MEGEENKKIRYGDRYSPVFKEGDYRIVWNQEIAISDTKKGTEVAFDYNGSELKFTIGCERFFVPAGMIHSTYPPAYEVGEFDTHIPQITFMNDSFPWERECVAEGYPWCVLFLFDEHDKVEVKNMTIGEAFLQKKGCSENCFVPDIVCQNGEKESDTCTVLDMPGELFEALMPKKEELPLLAHIRQVDVEDKASHLYITEGKFASIIGNRLCQKSEIKLLTHVHLISLEGYRDFFLKNRESFRAFGVDTEEEFKKRLSKCYWKLAKNTKESRGLEEDSEQKEYCTRMLCHGTLCGMEWKGKEEEYDTGIPKETPKVAVGNSSKEAFAALLAGSEKEEGDKERLATIFLEGQMESWLKKDGIIESEEKIHEKTFDSLYSKERWMLKRKPLGKEEEEALCTSPIIGWFVPDYMEGSLSVLDGKGKMLGRFTTIVDRKRNFDVIWVNAPQVGKETTEDRYDLPKKISGELEKCLREFYQTMKEQVKHESMVLYDFVNVLCNELCGMNKPGGAWKKDFLHFAKRPLALVQLGLKLEFKQKPAKPKSWEIVHLSKEKENSPLWNLRLPVRLGEGRKKGDGLAGFFKHGETTYDRFYTYHLDRRKEDGFIRQEQEIYLSCMDEMEENQFTLLMDPTLAVHIISGILPVKKIQLSAELVSASLGNLNMEIPVNPLLTGENKVQLPYMVMPEKTWTWVQIKDGYYKEEELGSQPSETAFETNYPIRLTEGWLRLSK